MKTLAGMMGFLRYLGEGDESPALLDQIAERASTLASPTLLKALPAYADLLVEMEKSGLLDRLVDFLAYFQGFSATIKPVPVIGVGLDYLQSTDFIQQIRQIRPDNLARLAAAASDTDTADVMTKGLRAIGMLKQTDLVGHVLNEGLKISSMMLDQEFLDTLPELLDTATMLQRSGLLAALRKLMMAFPQLYHLPWDEYFTAMIALVDQLEVRDLAAKIKAASEEAQQNPARLGGIGGMMHLMRDKQTQMIL